MFLWRKKLTWEIYKKRGRISKQRVRVRLLYGLICVIIVGEHGKGGRFGGGGPQEKRDVLSWASIGGDEERSKLVGGPTQYSLC